MGSILTRQNYDIILSNYDIIVARNSRCGDFEQDSQQDLEASFESTRDLTYLLHSLRLRLPALILTYDAMLGQYSQLNKIQTICKLFCGVKLYTLYRNALQTLGHSIKRSQKISDDGREAWRKGSRVLILCACKAT